MQMSCCPLMLAYLTLHVPSVPYILSPGSACLQARLTEQHPCFLHSQSQPAAAASKACPAAQEPRAECPGHLCLTGVSGAGDQKLLMLLEAASWHWRDPGRVRWGPVGMLRGSWGLGWVVGVERVWPRGRRTACVVLCQNRSVAGGQVRSACKLSLFASRAAYIALLQSSEQPDGSKVDTSCSSDDKTATADAQVALCCQHRLTTWQSAGQAT